MAEERKLSLMRVLTPAGQRTLLLGHGSDESSMIGRHWNAIKLFRNKGQEKRLQAFKGITVTGVDPESADLKNPKALILQLASDPEQVKKWAKEGELDDADPYGELEGGGGHA